MEIIKMTNEKYIKKRSKIGVVLYLLASWLPASRKRVDKLNLLIAEVFAAQRELQMITRQDVMILASKIMKFHGAEIMKEKTTNDVTNITDKTPQVDNTENMYG